MNGLDMRGLVMFSSSTCAPCRAAKTWLDGARVPVRVYLVDRDVGLVRALAMRTRQQTVPQFFFDGMWLAGGFSQVQQMVQRGEIPPNPPFAA